MLTEEWSAHANFKTILEGNTMLTIEQKIIGKINQGRIFKRTDIHDYLQIYLKFLAAR